MTKSAVKRKSESKKQSSRSSARRKITPTVQPRSVKWMGWRPDTPDHRDAEHYFRAQPRPLDPIHFLPARFMPAIRDQGSQGSCTGHMAYGIAHYVDAYCGGKTKLLSPAFAYWNARALEGETRSDSGAEIRDAIKGVVKFGIATEALCRYNPRSFKIRPSDGAFRNAKTEMITDYQRVPDGDLNLIKAAIAGDFPVGFGFSCYANLDDDRVTNLGILGMPSGKLDGGHAVWICGYDDGFEIDGVNGAVLIANSWGTDWGCKPPGYASRGYFWMSYAYISNRNLADDFWVCRKIT
jgi:hypothetical protein